MIQWPGAESNCRHADFQSAALPTELPGRAMQQKNLAGSGERWQWERRLTQKGAAGDQSATPLRFRFRNRRRHHAAFGV